MIDEVRSVDEVDDAEVELLEFDPDTRRLEMTVRVSSRYGEFTISEGVG